MKAEHRKELETNILADKMGKLISGAKEGPSRGFLFYLLVGLAAVVVAFLIYRWLVMGANKNAAYWPALDEGDAANIEAIMKMAPNEYPGKAARCQAAWQFLWVNGLSRLGETPKQALKSIEVAEVYYTELVKDCKDDPVFLPEALYGLAVIEETRLIEKKNRVSLALVTEKYQAVWKSNKDSAFGKLAKQRLDDLEDDTKSREILLFYNDLDFNLTRMERPLMPADGFDIEEFKKKFKGGFNPGNP